MDKNKVKLLAIFGNEINNFNSKLILNRCHNGYFILALDSEAMFFAAQNKLPYVCIDDVVDAETIYQCTVVANNLERNWYRDNIAEFTFDGICWPDFDRDAMYFYWRVATVAAVFMETFLEQGGEDIQYLSFDRSPSVFYYKSDTWKTIFDIYMGKHKQALGFDKKSVHSHKMLNKIKEVAGDIKIFDPIVIDSWGNDGTLNRMDYITNGPVNSISHNKKVIFALNPGELRRFMPVITNLAKEYVGEVKLYLLDHNSSIAREWETKMRLNVLPGPLVRQLSPQIRDSFLRAYRHIRANITDYPMDIFLNVDYHFEHYCAVRWPLLISLLHGWNSIWSSEKPAAVIVSSLMDGESQLPALAANRLGIETFSIPHTRFPRMKNLQVSKYITYDFVPYRDVMEKIGVANDRLIACKEIIGSHAYPTHTKIGDKIDKLELNVLVLVGNTRIGSNVFIPYALASKHIDAIKAFTNPPPEYRDSVQIKFKIHPLDPEYEMFELAGIDKEEYLLPIESDLLDALDAFDLVVNLNYYGASSILQCLTKKKPLLFWWDGLIKYADYNAEILLESGELITKAEDFWTAVGLTLSDQGYLDGLISKGAEFYRKYMDDQNYPSLPEIVADKTAQLLSKDKQMSTLTEEESKIIITDADPDFYYGEISKQDFMGILDRGKEINNIELAILEYTNRTHNEYFKEHALDPRRALCLKLLGNLRGKTLLDYGCGLGTLGITAAKHGAHVTFVDNCIPRLETARLRAKQHNLTNTRFIACKTWNALPSNLPLFDVVILNGILEWVATTSDSSFDNVIRTQLDFLLNMQQKLSPDGRLLLAIENRFALQYLLGYPEDHTDIQYLSIMSREEANTLHRKKKGKDFTAWTWSLNDYKELLPKAGLCLADSYAIFPDYRFPRLIINLEDKTGLRNGMLTEKYDAPEELKKRMIDYFFEMDLIQHCVYSYCLLLRKSHI